MKNSAAASTWLPVTPSVAVFKILGSGSFEDQKSSKHSISQGAAEEVLLY
jgi:hypothetical protein